MPAALRRVGITRGKSPHGGVLLLAVPLVFLVLLLEVRTARAFVSLQGTAFRTTSTRGHVASEATTTLRRHCGSASGSTLDMTGDEAAGRRRGGSAGWSSRGSTSCSSSSSSSISRSSRSTSSSKESRARVTALSMADGSEENRSVEEEWPFHKSRYGVCYVRMYVLCGTIQVPGMWCLVVSMRYALYMRDSYHELRKIPHYLSLITRLLPPSCCCDHFGQ